MPDSGQNPEIPQTSSQKTSDFDQPFHSITSHFDQYPLSDHPSIHSTATQTRSGYFGSCDQWFVASVTAEFDHYVRCGIRRYVLCCSVWIVAMEVCVLACDLEGSCYLCVIFISLIYMHICTHKEVL